MKTKYLIILTVVFATSCSDVLDQYPVTNLTSATYYKTADDAKAAVGACYAGIGGTDPFVDLVTSDDAIPFITGSADRPLLWRYNITSSNTFIAQYAGAYSGINRSNTVIGRLPGIAMDESLKARYIAEAKFLRAVQYFNLVRTYGGVPLVLTESKSLNDLVLPRESVETIYAQIETDLTEAAAGLPATYPAADMGRATQGAANGMLAKVYLTRAGTTMGSPLWAQAAAKAKEVMSSGAYALYDKYADAFSLAARSGKEILFQIQFLTDIKGHGLGRGYGTRSSPIYPGTGSGIARPTESLFNLFADNDERKAVTFMTSFTFNGVTTVLSISDPDPTKAVAFQKLWDPTSKVAGGEGTSIPIMRYSDVLLMFAEATNEASGAPTAEAYAALNDVRVRAGLDPLSALSYQEFKDAVWVERRREFVFENIRRYDLLRTGRLLDAVHAENSFSRNATIEPYHVLLPIPQNDMAANPALEQNPGY